jgi:poly(3-hydroxybutyrate) depolymerase
MARVMGQRAMAALERIERALARIEAAADRPPAAGPAEGDDRLREAHATLRARVEEAVAQIDRLLEGAR